MSEDELDVIKYLTSEPESLALIEDLEKIKLSGSSEAVRKGFALIIANDTIDGAQYEGTDISTSISICALDQFFTKLSFETAVETNLSAVEILDVLRKHLSSLTNHDAFLLYFLGFGKLDNGSGTIFGRDGQEVSLYTNILPMFAADRCKTLNNKPKIFLLQLAQPVGCHNDSVDANLSQFQSDNALWSDMLLFSTVIEVRPGTTSENLQFTFNLLYRALIKVTIKYASTLTLEEILRKVRTILLSQQQQSNSAPGDGNKLMQISRVFNTPNSKPIYLQMKLTD
jgi:hypothetical protein